MPKPTSQRRRRCGDKKGKVDSDENPIEQALIGLWLRTPSDKRILPPLALRASWCVPLIDELAQETETCDRLRAKLERWDARWYSPLRIRGLKEEAEADGLSGNDARMKRGTQTRQIIKQIQLTAPQLAAREKRRDAVFKGLVADLNRICREMAAPDKCQWNVDTRPLYAVMENAGHDIAVSAKAELRRIADLARADRGDAGNSTQHSADFTEVVWFGQPFKFTLGQQSRSVGLLWAEWDKGELGLHEKTIGDKVGSDARNFRLAHVFRDNPAWGTMIQNSGERGVFRLVAPKKS